MKKIVIYTLISFIFSVFASSCEDNKDNSLYYPDFTWDTGDGEEDEDPVTETSMRVATYNLQVETGTGWTNRRERVAQLIKAIINIIANKHITFFILSFPLIVSYIRADSLVSRILH